MLAVRDVVGIRGGLVFDLEVAYQLRLGVVVEKARHF